MTRTQAKDEMLPKKTKRKGAPDIEAATEILDLIGARGARIKLARLNASADVSSGSSNCSNRSVLSSSGSSSGGACKAIKVKHLQR